VVEWPAGKRRRKPTLIFLVIRIGKMSEEEGRKREKPVVVIVCGMAGSGKSTLLQRMNAHLHSSDCPPYMINLDPAVTKLPFDVNIDICDTVNYKEVKKQYGLGPNGGIMTSLNLFATRFDQVLSLCEKSENKFVLRFFFRFTFFQTHFA
jgi:GPN-loop GTPase